MASRKRRQVGKRLRKFVVTSRPDDEGPYTRMGTVALYDGAPGYEVEEALSAIGLYVPRGNDVLRWGNQGATIQDVHGGTTRLAKVGTGQPRDTQPKKRKRTR